MFDNFKIKLFGLGTDGLLCPKCERPLAGHDDGHCRRKMSRRFFVGSAVGVVLAATALPRALYARPGSPLFNMRCTKGGYEILSRRHHGVTTAEVEYLRSQGYAVWTY